MQRKKNGKSNSNQIPVDVTKKKRKWNQKQIQMSVKKNQIGIKKTKSQD